MNVRAQFGGKHTPARYGADNTRADSNLSPTDLAFPRGNLAKTMQDIFRICLGILLGLATGLGLAFALFCLFFVEIR